MGRAAWVQAPEAVRADPTLAKEVLSKRPYLYFYAPETVCWGDLGGTETFEVEDDIMVRRRSSFAGCACEQSQTRFGPKGKETRRLDKKDIGWADLLGRYGMAVSGCASVHNLWGKGGGGRGEGAEL